MDKKNDYSFSIPKLSDRALDERRSHILRAAELCFARDGFHATTIADVKKEAGVSTGAIYTYFRNKEAMIRAILERARDERRTALETNADGPAAEGARNQVLLEWVTAIFTGEGAHRARVDVNLWAEALRSVRVRKIAQSALGEANLAVSAVVAGPLAASEEPSLDPKSVATVLIALFLGLEVQTAVGMPVEPSEIVRVLAALFADYLPAGVPATKPRRRKTK